MEKQSALLEKLEPLFEKVEALPKPQRIALFVGIFVLIVGSFVYFFYFLRRKVCIKCVNFSCPLNKVPKNLVDSYLEKNPIMKEAWEASGYKLG